MSVNIIELGGGNFVINHGYYEKRAAIFIEPVSPSGAVGDDASASGLSKTECVEGGTIIVLGNLASAEVLIEEATSAMSRIGTL